VDRKLALTIADAPTAAIAGEFCRHVSPSVDHLRANNFGGRWGAPGAYPVLYLGRPVDSVVIEAYRHLIDDDLDGMPASAVGPRRLLTCEVNVEKILDLRVPETQRAVGLDADALCSDVGAYGPCLRVSQIAHQLELWGVIAPAAGGMGETLALFETYVPAERWPRLTSSQMWNSLPADPRRRLHLADAENKSA
jgi:RES domain-containing protein